MSQKDKVEPVITCTVFRLADESYVKTNYTKKQANIVGYEFAKSATHNAKYSQKMRENVAKCDQT